MTVWGAERDLQAWWDRSELLSICRNIVTNLHWWTSAPGRPLTEGFLLLLLGRRQNAVTLRLIEFAEAPLVLSVQGPCAG